MCLKFIGDALIPGAASRNPSRGDQPHYGRPAHRHYRRVDRDGGRRRRQIQICATFVPEGDGDFRSRPATLPAAPFHGATHVGGLAASWFPTSVRRQRDRVHQRIQAGASLAAAAIGVQQGGGADMVAPGLPPSFGGVPGFVNNLAAGVWGYRRPMVTMPGMNLPVDMQFNGPWPAERAGWYSMSDSHGTAAMAGAVLQAGKGCLSIACRCGDGRPTIHRSHASKSSPASSAAPWLTLDLPRSRWTSRAACSSPRCGYASWARLRQLGVALTDPTTGAPDIELILAVGRCGPRRLVRARHGDPHLTGWRPGRHTALDAARDIRDVAAGKTSHDADRDPSDVPASSPSRCFTLVGNALGLAHSLGLAMGAY